jgi:hypothetical protein
MSQFPESPRVGLGRRIDRFIAVLDHYRRPPNRRETYYLLLAIEYLRDARYEDGEAAVSAAGRLDAIPEPVSSMPGLYEDTTAGDLRAALRLALQGED